MYRYLSLWANWEEGIVDVGVVGVVELLEVAPGEWNGAFGDFLVAVGEFFK